MTYTEIQKKRNKSYYYRVRSIKIKGKVTKKRIYLGENLEKNRLRQSEHDADEILNNSLEKLLDHKQRKELQEVKNKFKETPSQSFENRYEVFLAKFTYDSNAIEGNTIDLKETAYILFENRTPKGKSLREINEVLNHKEAFDFILGYKKDITKDFICEIQKKVVKNTLKIDLQDQIGRYRTIQVYIRGVDFIPTETKEVPIEMRALLRWYNTNKEKLHPLILAAHFHIAFEAIHPFIDGNGRTGRLLLNFILHKKNFPMISIPNKRKLDYYTYLELAQQKNDAKPFVDFLYYLLISEQKYI